MRLNLAFELDIAGLVQPKGEMSMDIDFYAVDGRIEADIKEIEICDNAVMDALGKMFGKTILADEIARVINQAIIELPQRDPRVRKIEIL